MCVCVYRVDDNQVAVVGPYAKFHAAVLQVEREINYNDLTVALKDGWRIPGDQPSVFQQDLRLVHDGEVSISTATHDHTSSLHIHPRSEAQSVPSQYLAMLIRQTSGPYLL